MPLHLKDILTPDMIWPDVGASSKLALLEELGQRIGSARGLDGKNIARILIDREEIGSTGLEDGVAIPHGKFPRLKEVLLACARTSGGIDFDAQDGQPSRLFFVLLAPEESAGMHLKVL